MGRMFPRRMALEDHILLASSSLGFWELGLFCRVDLYEG